MLHTLAKLGRTTSDERFGRDLTYLMMMIWHDNDSCPAALAIAPHLAAFCPGASLPRKAACIQCIALFEIARKRALSLGFAPVVAAEIDTEYTATLGCLPELVAGCLGEPWDFATAVKLAGSLLVAKGYPVQGHEVMQLRSTAERGNESGREGRDGIPW